MSERAREKIKGTHPHLAKIVDEIGTLRLHKRHRYSIPEAVSRTVISQMLSASAAATIRGRAEQRAGEARLNGISELSYDDLRSCGLSNAKAKAITEFAAAYRANPARYEAWRTSPKDVLFAEVKQCWGLSNWSASILGIFYFGNPDILPEDDGSIRRAVELLTRFARVPNGKPVIDESLCRPYRSYLALYLWRMLDDGILAREVHAVKVRKRRAAKRVKR